MIKVIELFGGIGAPRKALERSKIDFEVVDYVEIDKYAVKSYNAIYNENYEPQDICKWDKDIECDLIFHGSPCQSFSIAGNNAGGDEGSKTKSSLMWETIRIVEKLRPKYVVWENVKNVLSKKHIHNFNKYIEKLDALGYKNFYKVLNAKDYGIPQNRERIFVVSIKNTNACFEFPEKIELKLKLKDLLESEVNEKYYLSEKQVNSIKASNYTSRKRLLQEKEYCDTLCARDYKEPKCIVADYRYDEGLRIRKNNLSPCITTTVANAGLSGKPLIIKDATKKGYKEAYCGDSINLAYANSNTRRGRVGKQVAQTLTTSCTQGVVVNES